MTRLIVPRRTLLRARFEQSREFRSLAHRTQLKYGVQLETLRETFPTQRITRFRKRDVKRYLETIESIGKPRTAKMPLTRR